MSECDSRQPEDEHGKHNHQQEPDELQRHEGDDAAIDVAGRHPFRRYAFQIEQRVSERGREKGGLEVTAMITANQSGSNPRCVKSGARTGT